MQDHPWQKYATAPLPLKIISWLTLVATGFLLFHTWMSSFTNFEPKPWLQEIYMNLLLGIPFFLFLAGSSLHDKKIRIPLLICFGVFIAGYALNVLDFHGVVDIYGLSFVMCISLLLLYLVYLVHFFRKRKTVLSFIKLAWFTAIAYHFIANRFIGGKQALIALSAAIYLLPLLMIWGMIVFFKRKN